MSVKRVGLARVGGKQAVLTRDNHRFVQQIEFVHTGRTSFREAADS